MIYIDPPYNTGSKDFTYNDKMVGEDDGYRHSKWLSFMNERLKIAQQLLADYGIIFISIDDNEQANLKNLCDSIFGIDNFITCFHWRNTGQQQNKGINIAPVVEYILCYTKKLYTNGKKTQILNKDQIHERKGIKAYKNWDKTKKNWFRLNPIQDKSLGKNSYTLINPKNGKEVYSEYWRITEEKYNELVKEDMIYWTDNLPNVKKYLDKDQGVLPTNLIDNYYNESGNKELQDILGTNKFSNPKPVELIKKIIKFCKSNDAIVLDFFAGSGTTGHAVMELNAEDGGNRKFILCTNNENNICEDVTYQRLKTVITGTRKDGSKYSDGIPANLKYYKTDFVSKVSEDDDYYIEDELTKHIKEMIELENAVELGNDRYVLLLSDEDADAFEQEMKNMPIEKVYIDSTIMLSRKAQDYLESKKVEVIPIPDYYFYKDIIAK